MATKNYKVYGWTINRLRIPIDDVEGHTVALTVSGVFLSLKTGRLRLAPPLRQLT